MIVSTKIAMIFGALAFSVTGKAHAAHPVPSADVGFGHIAELAAALDAVWVLIAAALVFMMQIGFMLLEVGAVRTKNAISVAQKNLLDFAFATLAFAAVGFGLAYGTATTFLPIGSDGGLFLFGDRFGSTATFFIFQVMFCGTAATIISGAVAERMRLRAYIALSILMAALVYPAFVHWAWGSALAPSSGAFLANMGFVDFAGSTVVHATGGWFALAACLMLGAREGRFSNGLPMRFGAHSAVLSSSGTLFLFVGWIGFNGGSTLAASIEVPGIIVNTILAGAAGGAVGYGLLWFGGAMLPERAINGTLGGLVAITAGCHLVSPGSAILLGALGALVANAANHLREKHLRIDDAVGAVGVHGAAGVIGTIGVALLAPAELLPAGSRMDQLAVQSLGSAINFIWAFGIAILLMVLIRPFIQLRVTPEQEVVGLNAAEHGASLGTDRLQAALDEMVESDAKVPQRLQLEVGDENEHLSETLNRLMDKLQRTEAQGSPTVDSSQGEEETLRMVAFGEMASESIFLINRGRIRSANAAAVKLFSTNLDSIVGLQPHQLVKRSYQSKVNGWLEADDGKVHRAIVVRKNKEEVPVELYFRHMVLDGHEVVVLRMADVTEREQAQKRIYHLALHDTLTDLPNRELFARRLKEALRHRSEEGLVSLLLVDVDRFKDVNDLYGHPSGDLLLMTVAERLKNEVRKCDTVARLGGDEFAIIYTNIAFPNQALDLAHRMLQKISEPLTLPTGTVIRPKASIGLAICPLDAADSDMLIQNADLALYSAKNGGRNGFNRYKPQMGRVLRLRQEFEHDLSQAVERNELELHYQPRIKVGTGELVGFEALVRWHHRGQVVSPEDFIPIAEESGLIIPIGAWVIGEACRTAASSLNGASVSVNVSARQFQDSQLIDHITNALTKYSLDPARLELEITESILIDDNQYASKILSMLHNIGVKVSLDDFGTGYSSLSYLTQFNFDKIKIDRSFIQSEDEKTWHVIRSVLQMSEGLGASVVAEGVETYEQFERLAVEGCDEVQGFLISRPVPACDALQSVPNGVWIVDSKLKVA